VGLARRLDAVGLALAREADTLTAEDLDAASGWAVMRPGVGGASSAEADEPVTAE
jgi:hypothetical protein